MRPRLITRTPLPGVVRTRTTSTGGWLITTPDQKLAHLYDDMLRPTRSIPLPTRERWTDTATHADIIAMTSTNTITAHRLDGTGRWSTDITGETTPPSCHLDGHGTLWTHLGERRQLLALDAATGHELARTALPDGDGWFTQHERGEWPVLNLAVAPPDDIHIVLPELAGDHITLRTLATDGHLIGFAGDHAVILGYGTLTTQRLDGSQRLISDLPDIGRDRPLYEAAAIVGGDLVLIALSDGDDGDYEEHILLSARSLRYRGSMTYPHPMQQNAIRPAATPGRWLTHSDDVLELWELDDTGRHATDSAGRTENPAGIPGRLRADRLTGPEEIPGQLGLFEPS